MCRETGTHGSAAETGGEILSSTVTGRATASALGAGGERYCCGPPLTASVRCLTKISDRDQMMLYTV